MVDDDYERFNAHNTDTDNAIGGSAAPPDFIHAKSILPLMNELPFSNHTCVVIGRVFFNDKVDVSRVPQMESLDPEAFSTLKFHNHLNRVGPLAAKVLLDVSRLDKSDMKFRNPHHGISPICDREGFKHGWPPRTKVRVHHYLGTLEEFLIRGDKRRDADIFEDKAEKFGGRLDEGHIKIRNDDDMIGWVEEFVKGVGGVGLQSKIWAGWGSGINGQKKMRKNKGAKKAIRRQESS